MEKQQAYLDKIRAKLEQYNAKLAEMKAKTAEIPLDMKIEYLFQVDHLKMQCDDLTGKYNQLKESKGHAWENIKSGTEKSWNEMENSIGKAISRFK